MRKSTLLLTLCLVFCSLVLQAQNSANTTSPQGPKTLSEQLSEIIDGSGNYRNNGKVYEVVEKYKLNQLQTNITKRIDVLQQEITGLNVEIDTQKIEIGSLTETLSSTENTLTVTNKEKDSMNFFGAQMSKGSYQMMMWGIAGALLLGLLLFIYKFNSSNTITNEARNKLDEVEAEFEEYRKKALEKEQKLGRQLQDERNKLLKASKG
ncbi:MAG: septal ring factor EnvC (AmiA/AmiB activator) [Dokdonia sp.]|jgi:septal ring factor EnvC (AmiA/AmiB activator)